MRFQGHIIQQVYEVYLCLCVSLIISKHLAKPKRTAVSSCITWGVQKSSLLSLLPLPYACVYGPVFGVYPIYFEYIIDHALNNTSSTCV